MIHPCEEADTDHLLALAAGTGVFEDHEIETLDEVLSDYHSQMQDYGHICITLQDDTAILGFAYFAPVAMADRTWELWWIVIDAQRHNLGLGRQLLEAVEENIQQLQGRLLLIETSSMADYEPTRQFYLRRGYAEWAHLPDFYKDGDHKKIYGKRLTPA